MTVSKVPLLDLNAQYDPIKDKVLQAIQEVFESKQFILGPQVAKLEQAVADYAGCIYAIGVTSGTDALIVSLMALDIGPGDEVITTPFTFFATAGSICRVGAVPVFVDIDPKTYNINPELIEEKVTKKTKAIMPVHLFGQTADMEAINSIAGKYNLAVVEDAAQAIGSSYTTADSEIKAGAAGDLGCFSFFPSKNLGCCGDGGMVTTSNKDLAYRVRILRTHGAHPKYYHKIIGGNFRLDSIQAAVLLEKLPYLEQQHKGRQAVADFYDEQLAGIVQTPLVNDNYRMIYNQYTIRTPERDALQEFLNKNNIGNAIYYPVPLHLQECFQHLGYKEGDLPESEKAAKEVLSIPVYAELTSEQQEYVAGKIGEYFGK